MSFVCSPPPSVVPSSYRIRVLLRHPIRYYVQYAGVSSPYSCRIRRRIYRRRVRLLCLLIIRRPIPSIHTHRCRLRIRRMIRRRRRDYRSIHRRCLLLRRRRRRRLFLRRHRVRMIPRRCRVLLRRRCVIIILPRRIRGILRQSLGRT